MFFFQTLWPVFGPVHQKQGPGYSVGESSRRPTRQADDEYGYSLLAAWLKLSDDEEEEEKEKQQQQQQQLVPS